MINFSSFHTHTYFCDGKNSPEEMVKEAISLGCPAIGFSGHSDTPFDAGYCMDETRENNYRSEIIRLKEEYKDDISIFLGIEQDYHSRPADSIYEYKIGSVHYVKKDGEYISIDNSPEILIDAVDRLYGGDIYALCEDYYKLVEDVYRKTHCQIVGHFDLITKFQEKHPLFDENNPRYKNAALWAINSLIEQGALLEMNTGAISRGWRTTPYPARFLLEEISKKKSKLILTSDCHSKEHILFKLDEAKLLCDEYNIETVQFTKE